MSDSDDDVSTIWAGSHVVLAALVFGLSRIQTVELALYTSILMFLALAFEYHYGPFRVAKL